MNRIVNLVHQKSNVRCRLNTVSPEPKMDPVIEKRLNHYYAICQQSGMTESQTRDALKEYLAFYQSVTTKTSSTLTIDRSGGYDDRQVREISETISGIVADANELIQDNISSMSDTWFRQVISQYQ